MPTGLKIVVVDQKHEIIEPMMACEHRGLPNIAFLQLAVR
jgi:hypothetical protein